MKIKVYLTSATNPGDKWWTDYHRVRDSASLSNSDSYTLTDDPEESDLIIFTDSKSIILEDIKSNELWNKYKNKIFVYDTQDKVVPSIPGLYTSLEKKWQIPSSEFGGFYAKVTDHDHISRTPLNHDACLFSFCGSFDTNKIRKELFQLQDFGFIKDTSNAEGRGFGKTKETYEDFATTYARSLINSKFILCPEGVAPSSYRIFESLKAARPPVIISDNWVPPRGPDWEKFSVLISPRSINEIPNILRNLELNFESMSKAALDAFNKFYCKEKLLDTIVNNCLKISRRNRNPLHKFFHITRNSLFFLRPHYFRHALPKLIISKLRLISPIKNI